MRKIRLNRISSLFIFFEDKALMELAKRNLPSDMAGTLCLAFCFVNLSVSFCLVNLNSAQGKGEQTDVFAVKFDERT